MPWDLVSSAYAAEVVPMFERYATDALRLAAPPPGSTIVDVACGPGTLSLLAAQRGLRVDALDFSPAMLARFEERQRELGVTGVSARLGDGQALPYADGAYAAGFSMFGLIFFPDRARGFAELRRVLAPGARAVVSSWPPLDENPVFAAMFAAVREAFARVAPNAPTGSTAFPLSTPDECRAEMSAAFSGVEVHRVPYAWTYDSADELWASLVRTMAPLVLLRKSLPADSWTTVSDAAHAAIARALDGGSAEIEMPAWLTTGVAR